MSNKEAKRIQKRIERQKHFKEPWKAKRWFELISVFDEKQIRPFMGAKKEDRMFILGPIQDVIIMSVPVTASPDSVNEAMTALSERGIRALAFTEDIKFSRLVPLSDEEGRLLDAKDNGSGIVNGSLS